MRILTIANLYPSKKNPEFGTFIKIIEDGIKDNLPGVKNRSCGDRQQATQYCRQTFQLFPVLCRDSVETFVQEI